MFLDREGLEIDSENFLTKALDWNYTVVGKDKVDNVTVTTVWLGFYSKTFSSIIRGGIFDGYEEQYEDEFDAVVGHLGLVSKVQDFQESWNDGNTGNE